CIKCNIETSNVENSLKQHLFCNGYDPKKRPAEDELDKINITTVAMLFDYHYHWKDRYLKWNQSDWSNITEITPGTDELWFPHFDHVNAYYRGESSLDCTNSHCSLYDTGTVTCGPVCEIIAKCSADYSRWPYSTLVCRMWFSNRDKELVDKINFRPLKRHITLATNGIGDKWCIASFESNETTLEYPGAPQHSFIEFTFSLLEIPDVA
uniref:Neurotransmitter-gated ion-channel ligand-binding domain-containing protein n=1 Tax=Anopheles dirus TaxID=7168 RepID=A0A182N8N5_9DIPT